MKAQASGYFDLAQPESFLTFGFSLECHSKVDVDDYQALATSARDTG